MNEKEIAIFGMGCFWHSEAVFGGVEGVSNTRARYSGGNSKDPTYANLKDHTEVVEIEFDPHIISYGKLLKIFFDNHPFDSNTEKIQYKSTIIPTNENQKNTAEKELLFVKKVFGKHRVFTLLKNFTEFYEAENYHQKHYLKINKKSLETFLQNLVDWKSCAKSELCTKLNGYLNGIYSEKKFIKNLTQLGLSESNVQKILYIMLHEKNYMAC